YSPCPRGTSPLVVPPRAVAHHADDDERHRRQTDAGEDDVEFAHAHPFPTGVCCLLNALFLSSGSHQATHGSIVYRTSGRPKSPTHRQARRQEGGCCRIAPAREDAEVQGSFPCDDELRPAPTIWLEVPRVLDLEAAALLVGHLNDEAPQPG